MGRPKEANETAAWSSSPMKATCSWAGASKTCKSKPAARSGLHPALGVSARKQSRCIPLAWRHGTFQRGSLPARRLGCAAGSGTRPQQPAPGTSHWQPTGWCRVHPQAQPAQRTALDGPRTLAPGLEPAGLARQAARPARGSQRLAAGLYLGGQAQAVHGGHARAGVQAQAG